MILIGRGVELHDHMDYFYPSLSGDPDGEHYVGTPESHFIGFVVVLSASILGFILPIVVSLIMLRKARRQSE